MHNNVLKLRNEKNFTQEEMADRLGVTRQTIISIEKGKYVPSLQLALKIASLFKLQVEDIFWEK